jgi:hypothetical protein
VSQFKVKVDSFLTVAKQSGAGVVSHADRMKQRVIFKTTIGRSVPESGCSSG